MLSKFIKQIVRRQKKIFILGVGAQRTGSTWLYSQLFKNPEIAKGIRKEYHFLDSLFAARNDNQSSRLPLLATEQLKIQEFIDSPDKYFKHFNDLYHSHQTITAVGEITPSYSMLDAQAYNFIRHQLERYNFVVKVVFIMRDPVERIWSMIHQKSKVLASKAQGNPINERKFTLNNFINTGAELRTQYDRTIRELEKAFESENIFYEFYEKLMTPESYKKLGKFLEMKLLEPNYNLLRNPSYKKRALDDELAQQVALYYKDTYHEIDRKFHGEARHYWSGYKYLSQHPR